MSVTSILRPFFLRRARVLDTYATAAQELQLQVLQRLIQSAKDTEWGHHHAYDAIRIRAGMPVKPVTLQGLLDERLLELCWEGWRRPDLIRFDKYKSLYEGPGAVNESDGHTKVYPIPADVRALNQNLTQNPGY